MISIYPHDKRSQVPFVKSAEQSERESYPSLEVTPRIPKG